MRDDFISRRALYKKTVDWEQQAFHQVRKTINEGNQAEYMKWCIILNERTAFKFDVADAPSAQQWIPCSERLPEEGKEVLISTNGSIYTSAYDMIAGRPFWYDTAEYITIRDVDAWMPLPEPYKQEENR